MNYDVRRIENNTIDFISICSYIEEKINRENLSKNGGTLNYSNLTYRSDILFVAYADETPIGYNSVVECENGYYIYQIAVKKEYQQQGIGTSMMNEIMEVANQENKNVYAHVMNYNKNSQKMFNRLGFKKISEDSRTGNGFYEFKQKENIFKKLKSIRKK